MDTRMTLIAGGAKMWRTASSDSLPELSNRTEWQEWLILAPMAGEEVESQDLGL
ncbi:MAG: hypothetical protein ACUVX1_10785 [Chloroflexota bacterium]